MRRFLIPILVGVLAAQVPDYAQAQGTICGPRLGIVDALKSKFSEEQNGIGVVNQATVFELFVSVEGSWTMLATNTAGISCIVGSGTSWQPITIADKNARAS